jgi:serine/threonine-protein kinase
MAQSFDPESGEVHGVAFVVAKGIALTSNLAYAPISVAPNGTLLYLRQVSSETAGQIFIYDRAGKPEQVIGIPGDRTPSISPDQKSVAYNRGPNIWLRDLSRGNDQVLVNDGRENGVPLFSPAGDHFAFGTKENGIYQLYERLLSPGSKSEALVKTDDSKSPAQWTSSYFVYQQFNPKMQRDIWLLPMAPGEARRQRPFLQTEADELFPEISPDGGWIAYTSDVSGRREVYVRRFPDGDQETLISTAGGEQPRWASKSKELFFASADGRLMVVDTNIQGGAFKPGSPRALFDMHLVSTENGGQPQYSVSSDGQRFFAATVNLEFASAPPLTLVQNWQSGFSERK